jgi:tRNA (guanine-N7-)-methyltransferase
MVPPQSVSVIHIYFPDPWPKRKHWPNRLINDAFTEVVARALIPSGVIYLRTDDVPYFTQMKQVFDRNLKFEAVSTPPALKAVLTDFERGFHARGVSTLHAAYRLKAF